MGSPHADGEPTNWDDTVHTKLKSAEARLIAIEKIVKRLGYPSLLAFFEKHEASPAATRNLPRTTDEELRKAYRDAYNKGYEWARAIKTETSLVAAAEMAGLLAVADRVRQEQCLVTRAVEMGHYIYICPDKVGRWEIECEKVRGRSLGTPSPANTAPSDVSRVLSEMLGENGTLALDLETVEDLARFNDIRVDPEYVAKLIRAAKKGGVE
jgi:hypothetical protein